MDVMMAEYMQEEIDPETLKEEMELVELQLENLQQEYCPEQPGAPEDSSKELGGQAFIAIAKSGKAMRGLQRSMTGRRFVEKAGSLLDEAEKYSKCLRKGGSKHEEWITQFCGSDKFKGVLEVKETEKLIKKCKSMNPKDAVAEISGKIKSARQNYMEKVVDFEFQYSIFNAGLAFFECCMTLHELKKLEIHCNDGRLDALLARLEKEEEKLKEIKPNEPREIIKLKKLLENLKDIRHALEMFSQDLKHRKKDIEHRRNGHVYGFFSGIVNVIHAAVDYSAAAAAGVSKGLALATGLIYGATTVGHAGTGLLCQDHLNKIETRLVKIKEYEERAKKVVTRVDSLVKKLRMMNSAPAAQTSISARATPSPVA